MKNLKIISIVFVISAMLLSACSPKAPVVQATQAATTDQTGSATTAAINMQNFAFSPDTLTIKAGTTVTWTNQDDVNHTVTSYTGLFDSGELGKGGTFSYTFTQPGTYKYHCIPHVNMVATIIVN
jgi:plastocyanin